MSSAPKQRPPSFIDLYLRGKCLPEDIDDFVDAWHESGDEETRLNKLVTEQSPDQAIAARRQVKRRGYLL